LTLEKQNTSAGGVSMGGLGGGKPGLLGGLAALSGILALNKKKSE